MSYCAVPPSRKMYRSLFLSDLHLGSRSCRAEALLDFLQQHEAECIYLVGDIFDVWRNAAFYWTPQQELILTLLCERRRQGVNVIRLPGNHDPLSQHHSNAPEPLLRIMPTAEPVYHTTANQQRFLVTHGDGCDYWFGRSPLISRLGSAVDGALRAVTSRKATRPKFAQWLIDTMQSVFNFSRRTERRLIASAQQQRVDGVICGHLHKPSLRASQGVLYANCGDWVDNASALVEDFQGEFHLLHWQAQPAPSALPVRAALPRPMITTGEEPVL
ncbi:UDP-2,3-diacylglucosamine hydrolase [Enterobacterales bacterium CwR94]|nr:UDP-2,3-diacylglucosamine hydrolase [Enterobacterales bacterium CwR94]